MAFSQLRMSLISTGYWRYNWNNTHDGSYPGLSNDPYFEDALLLQQGDMISVVVPGDRVVGLVVSSADKRVYPVYDIQSD